MRLITPKIRQTTFCMLSGFLFLSDAVTNIIQDSCKACQMLEKKWEYNETVHQLFIDFKKAYDSVRREVLYNILMEFGIPKKLIRLIKMCLTET